MSKDYDVGKGKPPKETQFKPGKSGNPKRGPNRPPKSFGAALRKASYSTIRLNKDGELVVMTKMEAAAEVTVQQALKGARWAIEKLEQMETGGRTVEKMLQDLRTMESKFKEVVAENEALKARPTGVLAIPGAPVNSLESMMMYTPAHELVPYIMEHPEELADMIDKKNILVRSSDLG